MPKEETWELRHIRDVLGEKYSLANLNARSSLMSLMKAIVTKLYGVPQLIHLYGALGLNKALSFAAGEDGVFALFSDGTYLYAGLNTTPGKIIKVDLLTFTKVSTLTFAAGEDSIYTLVSDGTYLYAGLNTLPGKIVKVNLSTFTKVSTLTLSQDRAYGLFSDGTYLYAGMHIAPLGKIIKVDLATFTEVSTLTFAAGENNVYRLFLDGTHLYAGLDNAPGKIIKVDLSTFTEVATLTLSAGENNVNALFSDGTYLYAGLNTTPGKIIKVDLLTFTKVSTLTFAAGEDGVFGLFADGTYIYAGLNTTPGKIVKVNLSTFTKINTLIFTAGNDSVFGLFSDGTYLYTGLGISPGKVLRTYIIPSNDLHQRKIDLIDEQVHTGNHDIYPYGAVGITLTSGAGAFTFGNYTQIIPVNIISTTYYITDIFIHNISAVNTLYEIQIATGLAGSEIPIIYANIESASLHQSYEIPINPVIKISSKTRLSSKILDETGANTLAIKIRYKQ